LLRNWDAHSYCSKVVVSIYTSSLDRNLKDLGKKVVHIRQSGHTFVRLLGSLKFLKIIDLKESGKKT
jgi:hypothetical protein